MSAYMMHEQTIGILAKFAIDNDLTKYGALYNSGLETIEEVATELAKANFESVNNRYGIDHDFDFTGMEDKLYIKQCINEAKRAWNLTPAQIAKSARCYEYQACEPENWYETTAYKIITAISVECASKLEGYEAAPWGYVAEKPPGRLTNLSDMNGRSPAPGEVVVLGR